MQENPAISDRVPISGGSTEGLLGGWLAQRQAALREVMAAGALSTFALGLPCVPVVCRAACVPNKVISGKPRPLVLEVGENGGDNPIDRHTAPVILKKWFSNMLAPKKVEPSHC